MSRYADYSESSPGPYRGGDRRSVIAAGGERARGTLRLALALLVALCAWATVDLVAGNPGAGGTFAIRLDTAAAVLAFVAAVLYGLRWRLVGDAAALWLGFAVLLLGLSSLVLPAAGIAPPARIQAGSAGLLAPALRLAAAAMAWQALRTPQVDAALRWWHGFVVAPAITVAGLGIVTVAQGLAHGVAGVVGGLPAIEASTAGSLLLVPIWLALATGHRRRARRDGHALHSWFALVPLTLALAESVRLAAAASGAPQPLGVAALGTFAFACACLGSTDAFVRTYAEQRGRLFETVANELTAEAKVRAEQLLAQERAHEARNALTAIEGASRTLETYRDRLDAETQRGLSRAITHEIARLQHLVSADDRPRESQAFALAETLASVVVGARAQGTTVEVRVPDDLVACGRPGETAEVVQNLIENARRYAPGSVVFVRAYPQGDRVVVRVEDRGPGVPPTEREAIFQRGFRGRGAADADGTGLGLYICARLMREQGGELWVEDRVGGGASFALRLLTPAAAASGPGTPEPGPEPARAPETAVVVQADNVYPLFSSGRSGTPLAQSGPRGDAGSDVGDDIGR